MQCVKFREFDGIFPLQEWIRCTKGPKLTRRDPVGSADAAHSSDRRWEWSYMVDENHTMTISGDSIPEFSSCKNVCAQFLLHSVSRKCDSINGATNDLLSALIRTSHDSVGAALWQRTKIMLERANRGTPHCWKPHAPVQNVTAMWKSELHNERSGFKGLSGDHAASLYVLSAYVDTFVQEFVGSLVQF